MGLWDHSRYVDVYVLHVLTTPSKERLPGDICPPSDASVVILLFQQTREYPVII